MGKHEEFCDSLVQDESIMEQLEDAQQRKVIKSFRKLMKSECFVCWEKGFCEWCNEPFLEHECKYDDSNWIFLVMYDEVEDYVIAIQFYDHDALNVVDEICESVFVEGNESKVDVVMQEVVECVGQEALNHPLSMSQSSSTFSTNHSTFFPDSSTLSLLPQNTSSQNNPLLTNSKTTLLPIPLHKHGQTSFGDLKCEWSALFDFRELHSWGNYCMPFGLTGYEFKNIENVIPVSIGDKEYMGLDQILGSNITVFSANFVDGLLLVVEQGLGATVNEATIVAFVSGQLNNLKIVVNLAKWGNLPGAENLVVQRFQELFAQTNLRTPDNVAKFQSVPVQSGQKTPLLQYFGTLLIKGKLNAFGTLVHSLAEDKLECSVELGDLVNVHICKATAYLLDVLKPNLPEHSHLQTKVLEIKLVTFPNVADAILANGMFSHYDNLRIAQLCEKVGLYLQAITHYSELQDVKQVMINTHAIELQPLMEFFGTLPNQQRCELCTRFLHTLIRPLPKPPPLHSSNNVTNFILHATTMIKTGLHVWGKKFVLCHGSVWEDFEHLLQVRTSCQVLMCEYLRLIVLVMLVFDPGGLRFNLCILAATVIVQATAVFKL